jgi:hypothetical protein
VKLSKNLPLLTLTIVMAVIMGSANAQNKPVACNVEQIAKTRHAAVYDGFELTDNKTKIKIPKGKPEWTFTLSDFDSNKFQTQNHSGRRRFSEDRQEAGLQSAAERISVIRGH